MIAVALKRWNKIGGRSSLRRSLHLAERVVGRMLTRLSDRSGRWHLWVSQSSAEKRSLRVLKENLSPRQREQYETLGYFDVVGSKTARRYRIHHGCQLNIEQLDASGKRVRLLCFKPTALAAVGDIMLAQKLALELFEEDAIRVSERFFAPPPCRHYIRGASLRDCYRALPGHDEKSHIPTSAHVAAARHGPLAFDPAPGDRRSPAECDASPASGERDVAGKPPACSAAVSPTAAMSCKPSAHYQGIHATIRSENATRSKA